MDGITFEQLRNLNEDQARELLEHVYWPDGAICPHCGGKDAYKLTPTGKGRTHVRSGVYVCKTCHKQFTVTVGTVFEGSHIKITNWLMAVYLICSSKKGMSAHQLHRTIGITYKAAWFMAHRIRLAMSQGQLPNLMDGQVELDATYIGGKEKNKHENKKTEGYSGPAGKIPVFALVERGGELRARRMRTLSNYSIRDEVRKYVYPSATLMTDESPDYKMVYKEYPNHEMVCHKNKEYVRGEAHVNTLEGWFSLLKRGVNGTFHHVSEQHLDRYVSEFAFRYNLRELSDAERAVQALMRIGGKRLMYKETIANNLLAPVVQQTEYKPAKL